MTQKAYSNVLTGTELEELRKSTDNEFSAQYRLLDTVAALKLCLDDIMDYASGYAVLDTVRASRPVRNARVLLDRLEEKGA